MSTLMRAKLAVRSIEKWEGAIQLKLSAVCSNKGFDADGKDTSEDNDFARWTPCADLTMTINNPNLLDKFTVGQSFYVDFTQSETAQV